MNETCVTLENATHLARLYPLRGGKTGSFIHKATGFEIMQPPHDGVYPPLDPGMPFYKSDTSGFDDVFPSMGAERYSFHGHEIDIPDHGEIWTMPMRVEVDGLEARFTAKGAILPYCYEKTVRLDGDTLEYAWRVQNTGDISILAMWVCHCLMRREPDTRFEFPDECHELIDLFPGKGALLSRPASGWDAALPPEGKAMKFYFTEPVPQGRCAAVYPLSGMRAEMNYDSAALPYLGFWITTGGYRGDQAFAFEPATGYCDTIEAAEKTGRLPMLASHARLEFSLSIRLSALQQ